jgi:hypothetical protein
MTASTWYVSSVAYTAITQFAISHAYSIGDIVRSLAAPANNSKGVFRCTTAGTSGGSESAWQQSNGSTTTQGGAVFTTVTGSSTYHWSAAAGDLGSATGTTNNGFAAAGDTVYVSSDHSESFSNPTYFNNISGSWNVTTFVISVNRGGSVPPVAADITSGATLTASASNLNIDPAFPIYFNGVTIAATAGNITFNGSFYRATYFKNCALQLNSSSAASLINCNNPARITLDNTTVSFGKATQGFSSASYSFDITWINTASALLGTMPTNLFIPGAPGLYVTCRGVDLSATTGTLVQSSASNEGVKALFDSCKIASSVTRFGTTSAGSNDAVELVNCYDGTNTINEYYSSAGKVLTERTIVVTGGATDDIGTFSLKMVSASTGLSKWGYGLDTFWFDVENTATGSSKTATVEINSSAALNNDDIFLTLEYQGTSSSPVASFATSLPTTLLTANAAITTSSQTWTSSPATPAPQKIQITFTPQVAGRVRGKITLGKISTTVYVNPVITIT